MAHHTYWHLTSNNKHLTRYTFVQGFAIKSRSLPNQLKGVRPWTLSIYIYEEAIFNPYNASDCLCMHNASGPRDTNSTQTKLHEDIIFNTHYVDAFLQWLKIQKKARFVIKFTTSLSSTPHGSQCTIVERVTCLLFFIHIDLGMTPRYVIACLWLQHLIGNFSYIKTIAVDSGNLFYFLAIHMHITHGIWIRWNDSRGVSTEWSQQ